jgi:regulator of sigma E protease
MEIGKITAIQRGSPAWAGREGANEVDREKMLQVGDKITHVIVDGKENPVGSELDPLRLPDFFAELAGQEVVVRVKRERKGKEPEIVNVSLTPEARAGWIERPMSADCPLSVPAIGVAFHVLHNVVKVDPNGPAAGKIRENDSVQSVDIVMPDGKAPEGFKPYEFGEKKRNWATVFWHLQSLDPSWRVRLKIIPFEGAKDPKTVELTPVPDAAWFLPTRGILPKALTLIKQADGVGSAIQLGFRQTRNSVLEVFFTIRGLASGRISKKALGGPITIAQVAFIFSERGVPDLILFLAILSVNLAVLNFLPVPVLDGGHFMFLCWEGIRGKPPSERVVIAANYVGLAMVLSLMVWVIWLDISRLL